MSGWPWKPKPPTPPAPTTRTIAVIVCNEDGDRIPDATCWMQTSATGWLTGQTGADGVLTWPTVPAGLANTQLRVAAEGYVTLDQGIVLTPNINQQVWLGPGAQQPTAITLPALQRDAPPEPVTDPRLITARVCDRVDSFGRVVFQSCLADQPVEMRREWLDGAVGDTHFNLSVESGYVSGGIVYYPRRNFYPDHMPEWLGVLDEVLAHPGRFWPHVVVQSGDSYPGDGYITAVMASIPASYYDRCVWQVAWEAPDAGYTSKQYDTAKKELRAALGPGPIIIDHFIPGRPCGSSNPVQSDDPWQGAEGPYWHLHSGIEADVFCYQGPPPDEDPTRWERNVWGEPKWQERWIEIAERFLLAGTPMPGAKGFKVEEYDGNGQLITPPRQQAGVARGTWPLISNRGGRPWPTLMAWENTYYLRIRGLCSQAHAAWVSAWFRSAGAQGTGDGASA